MKKQHYFSPNKWFSFYSTSLIAIASFACADYGYDYLDTNFTPETFVSKNFEPLNYDPVNKFYDGNTYYGTGLNSLANENGFTSDVGDWFSYMNKSLNKQTIQAVMYEKADDRNAQIKKLQQNTNTKVRRFAEFVLLANQVDGYAAVESDPWDYKPGPLMNTKLAQQVETKYNNEADSFLKSRYWFLTLKAYFYSKDKNEVIRFFDQTHTKHTNHKYYVNALDYVGGAFYAKKDYVNSNLYFAEVAQLDPTKLMPASKDFKILSDSDFTKMLNQAKNNDIKCMLWTLVGYKKDLDKALREVYALNPKSENLNMLLVRAINIDEAKFTTFYEKEIVDASNDAYKKRAAKAVDENLYKFVKKVAENADTKSPNLWNLANGYLAMYKGDYKTASTNYQKVLKTSNETLIKDQVRLFSLLNNVLQFSKSSSFNETSFINDYNWLFFSKLDPEKYYADYDKDKIRVQSAQNFINQYLANIYKKEKNGLMAQFVKPDSKFFLDDKNLQLADSYFGRNTFTDWEKSIQKLYHIKPDDVYKQIAFRALQKDDLSTALTYLNKVKNQDKSFYNPFNGSIKDRSVKESKRELAYKQVVEMMQDMKKNLDSKTDVYNNALLLGNAYYNLGYFGNNREVYWNAVFLDFDTEYPSTATYKYDNSLAKKYYKIAFDNANDDEQKAKITYLLTKIERNEFYTKSYFLNQDYYGYSEIMFKKFEGYKTLKEKYKHTKYYKEVINECGYFKKYSNLG